MEKVQVSSRQGYRRFNSISQEVRKASTSTALIQTGEVLAKVTSRFVSPLIEPIVCNSIKAGFSAVASCLQQDIGIEDNDVQEKSESQNAEGKVDLRRPNAVDNFVGRKDVLRELKKIFKKKKGESNFSIEALLLKLSIKDRKEFRRVCIAGMGGVGKTQIVAKYLKDCKKKKLYKSTYWINAEEKRYLDKSFVELAKRLEIEENKSGLIDRVYKKMDELSSADGRSTIVILDNADDSYLVENHLPNPSYQFIDFFIISRWRAWENMEMRVMPVNPFTRKESKEFIKNELKENNVNEEIEKLAKKLGHFPLALKQAVGYISKNGTPIKQYLKIYEEKADELLNFVFWGKNDQYKKTVFTTWLVTLDEIKKKENGKNAIKILNVMAYLAPDDIEDSMLSGLGIDPSELASAVRLLKNYSMLGQGKKDGSLDINRLVQEVVHINLKTKREEKRVLRNAIEVIKKGNISESHLDSFMCVCKHAMEYPDLNKGLKEAFELLKGKLARKKENEKYLRTAGDFLLAAVKFGNKELVKLALDNIDFNPKEKKVERMAETISN